MGKIFCRYNIPTVYIEIYRRQKPEAMRESRSNSTGDISRVLVFKGWTVGKQSTKNAGIREQLQRRLCKSNYGAFWAKNRSSNQTSVLLEILFVREGTVLYCGVAGVGRTRVNMRSGPHRRRRAEPFKELAVQEAKVSGAFDGPESWDRRSYEGSRPFL